MNIETKHSSIEDRFVAYLTRLVEGEERAALAALRRSLGKAPGEAAEAHPYVLPFIGNATAWDEDAYYLVAALFALHQINWPPNEESNHQTNLGASFAWLRRKVESDSIEKRFVALLNCHHDDLPDHLRHAVSLLRSKEIPIDWARLLRDLRWWHREDRSVQRNWARAFWGRDSGFSNKEPNLATHQTNHTIGPKENRYAYRASHHSELRSRQPEPR